MKRPRDLEADEADLFEAVQRHVAAVAGRIGVCPDLEQLHRAYAGRLAEADAQAVFSHAASCPMCQTLLEATAGPATGELTDAERARLDARIGAVVKGAAVRGRRLPFTLPRRWRWRVVAALSAAATLAWFVLSWNAGRPLMSLPPVPPPPVVARVTPPTPPILVAERLETRDMGLASLAWRGDAGGVPPWPAFDAACQRFARGEFAEAERTLVAVTASAPALGDAWLLLGVSHLFLGRPDDAIAPLARARDLLVGAARDDAAWHLAVALQGVGRREEARALLGAMCASPSPRAPMACLAMDELAKP